MGSCDNEAKVHKVDDGDEFYHVRVRDPDGFSRVRTLDDPEVDGRVKAARSVGAHAIKVGEDEDKRDTWCLQSVLVKKRGNTKRSAKRNARETINKLED